MIYCYSNADPNASNDANDNNDTNTINDTSISWYWYLMNPILILSSSLSPIMSFHHLILSLIIVSSLSLSSASSFLSRSIFIIVIVLSLLLLISLIYGAYLLLLPSILLVITNTSSTNSNSSDSNNSKNNKKLIIISIGVVVLSMLYQMIDIDTYNNYINSIKTIDINSIITPKLSSSVYHPSVGVIWYLEALVFPEFREYFVVLCSRYI